MVVGATAGTATILFSDVVASTQMRSVLGDTATETGGRARWVRSGHGLGTSVDGLPG